jgi:hypothetical protein
MNKEFEKEVLEFYRECYQAELEKKETLLERVNLATGILTIMGGALAYYVNSMEVCHFRWIHLMFYIPFSVACISTLVSMIFVAIAFAKGFGYAYIAPTTKIAKYLEESAKYNETVPDNQKIDVQSAFFESLSRQYCEYASVNRNNNFVRSGHIFKSMRYGVVSMFIAIVAIPGFLILQKDFETKPTAVMISHPIQVRMR